MSETVSGIPAALAAQGVDVPTADEYQQLLDLREKVQDYLERGADIWFEHKRRTDPQFASAQVGSVIAFDASTVTYAFFASPADAQARRQTHAKIAIRLLLPDYSQMRGLFGGAPGF